MMLTLRVLRGVVDGSVDRAFRRWPAPRVKPGGRQRTAVGVIGFDAVEPVERAALTDDDARRAAFGSLDDLLAFVDRREEGTIYRIELRLDGPDPRVGLREAIPDDAEAVDVERRLARLDRASRHGPWTGAVLMAIRDRPGTPAAELAAAFGREKMPFKLDVRKLKELGLTESLRPGYRLSPRGAAIAERLAGAALTPRSRRRYHASRGH
jgi:hypothetical protein